MKAFLFIFLWSFLLGGQAWGQPLADGKKFSLKQAKAYCKTLHTEGCLVDNKSEAPNEMKSFVYNEETKSFSETIYHKAEEVRDPKLDQWQEDLRAANEKADAATKEKSVANETVKDAKRELADYESKKKEKLNGTDGVYGPNTGVERYVVKPIEAISKEEYRKQKNGLKSKLKNAENEAKEKTASAARAVEQRNNEREKVNSFGGVDVTMQDNNDAKRRGCSGGYNSASCDTTNIINMAVKGSAEMAGTMGGRFVNDTTAKKTDEVNKKGGATMADTAAITSASSDAVIKSSTIAATINTIGLVVQADRMLKHLKSRAKIDDVAETQDWNVRNVKANISLEANPVDSMSNANNRVKISAQNQAEYNSERKRLVKACTKSSSGGECIKEAEETALSNMQAKAQANIKVNALEAQQMQEAQAKTQMLAIVETAQRLGSQISAIDQAKTAKQSAADQAKAGGFSFNPGTSAAITSNTGVAAAPTPLVGDVTSNDTSAGDKSKDPAQTNPNTSDGNPNGNVKDGAFASIAPPPAAGGGGGGPGSAGGTSAAKTEEGNAGNHPAGKNALGTYTASDSAPPPNTYSRTPAGGAVTGDSIAGLLEKFLPGGAEDKKANADLGMNLENRQPSSGKMAVLDQSANLFEEVHRCYIGKKAGLEI